MPISSREAALSTWARRHLRLALLTVAAITIGFSVWGGHVTDDPLGIIRSQLAFTPGRFTAVVATWDIGQFLALTAGLDFVLPLAYGISIVGVWARTASSPTRWHVVVPLTAAATDWMENVLHMSAAASVRAGEVPPALLVGAGSAFAAAKWGIIIGALALVTVRALRLPGRAWRFAAVGIAALDAAILLTVITAAR